MGLVSSRRLWGTLATSAVIGTGAIVAAGWVIAGSGGAGVGASPRADDRVGWAILPMAAAGVDLASLDPPPVIVDTPVPTDTATPESSPTPTEIVCPPLRDRVRVSALDVSPSTVRVSANRGRTTWPVYLAPLPDGGAKIAWADQNRGVHVTTVDADDRRLGRDVELNGDEVRGLVAHEDGGTALMVVMGNVLSFVRLDAAGDVVVRKDLIGLESQTTTGSKWVDDWGHEARLVWAEGMYGLYSGHTQYFGAAQGKHQGDLFWFLDGEGNRLDVRRQGWDWGCSHSLDLRLAHNGTRFGPVCLSDAYPKPGFYFNHRELEVRPEPSGDGRGGSDARLGGWVPLPDGFLMSFVSPEGRSSSDVGLIKVYNEGTKDPAIWLTNTPSITENAPHLARYGEASFLASWMANENHMLAVVDEEGELLEGPTAIDARIGARDDFQTMPDGDVAWAAAWDDFSRLKLVRVDACGSAPIFTPAPPPTAEPSPEPTATPAGPTVPPTPGPSPTPTLVPTAGPRVCRDILANGSFEAGLNDWSFDGEARLGFSDRSGGRYGVQLLGRNDVTASLRQRVTVPAGAASAHLVYWWRMNSQEAVTSVLPYDTLSVSADGSTAPPGALEVVSNLSGRDLWRPSAHRLSIGATRELVFHAESNRRDPTTFLVDDVQVIVCTGAAAEFPTLAVDPAVGPAGSEFQGRGSGFEPGEAVTHWALEPTTRLRFDLGSASASAVGELSTAVRVRNTPGSWRWAAVGATSLLPGDVGFTVSAAP